MRHKGQKNTTTRDWSINYTSSISVEHGQSKHY